jgi:c-di-GMP-binding flagellar brake protein YcgR
MANKEKRRYPRIESLNLIAYACLNENEKPVNQGMGRTLNVSRVGLLLETAYPLDCENVLLIDVGLMDDLIDIIGRVVHTRLNKDGKHETGIEFVEIDEGSALILKKYIDAFNEIYS